MMKELSDFFEFYVKVSRVKVGKKQTLETLIKEESLLLSKYIRDERKIWIPRLT
jgi:hypothetical protein